MITRRGLLQSGLQLTLAGSLVTCASAAIAADAGTCADAKMDAGLASSLHYTEHTPDPAKPCEGCGFFTAGSGGCGACAIFNSSVNSKGHCDSWAPKG
jgi:hypothetical protein